MEIVRLLFWEYAPMFQLHPRLAAETVDVATWPLCRVRLMNDSAYPWLVLIPQRAGVVDIHELSPEDRNRLIHEIALASQLLQAATNADAMNACTFGRQDSQLHVHILARFRTDPAWPKPVWGARVSEPYDETTLSHTLRMLRAFMEPPLHPDAPNA